MWLKYTHIVLALLSGMLFIYRGMFLVIREQRVQQRLLRVLPHLIDTALLASALLLLWQSQISFVDTQWLQMKVALVIMYILAGIILMRFTRQTKARLVVFCVALGCYFLIIYLALTKPASVFGY